MSFEKGESYSTGSVILCELKEDRYNGRGQWQ